MARFVLGLALVLGAVRPAAGQASLPVLDVPYISQTESLCGGAAAAMVLRYWGERGLSADSFSHLVDTSAAGIRTDALVGELAARGWRTSAVAGTVALLDAALSERRPVLALVEDRPGRFHYVVVVASTPAAIVFHDPARTPFRVQSREEFSARWRSAGNWMALVMPPPAGGRAAAPPEGDVAVPPAVTGDACTLAVSSGVSAAQAGDLTGAERLLTSALSCRGSAVLRELAGVRVLQQRWADARDLSAAAVAADPGDTHAWKVLATSRFLQDDRRGALSAWNRAGEPRVDLVRVEGLTRTRARVVEDMLGVSPGDLLTPGAFDRARRRLSELPPATSTALDYVPAPGGRAELRANVAERSLLPSTIISQAAIGIGAAFTRAVKVSTGSLAGGGDRLTGEWRFWPGRPKVAFDYLAPAPWGGVWGVTGAFEEQPFDRPDVALIRRTTARVSLADWAAPRVRWSLRTGVEEWRDIGRFVQTGGSLRLTALADRFIGDVDLDAWSGDRAFGIGQVHARLRTSTEPKGWVATGLVGLGVATDRTPADSWFAGDTGLARQELLRAHPVVIDGRLRTDQMGRSVVHGSFEAQRWWRVPLVAIGAAAFVDTVRLERRFDPGARRDVDVGGGLRATVPGLGGMLRVDLGKGLRDGATRVSFVYEP